MRFAWCSTVRRRWPTRSSSTSLACAAKGIVRYGTHRQHAAMMTCFTPSPSRSNHVHFIDGAMGGYAMAANAMKAAGLTRVTPSAASFAPKHRRIAA